MNKKTSDTYSKSKSSVLSRARTHTHTLEKILHLINCCCCATPTKTAGVVNACVLLFSPPLSSRLSHTFHRRAQLAVIALCQRVLENDDDERDTAEDHAHAHAVETDLVTTGQIPQETYCVFGELWMCLCVEQVCHFLCFACVFFKNNYFHIQF